MPRSKSRRSLTIPVGWTPHNGGGCPVDPLSKPAVMFRIGSKTPRDMQTAEHWINMGEGSCWDWKEGSRGPMDIVAFWPEDDIVEIPVIDLSRSASEQGL